MTDYHYTTPRDGREVTARETNLLPVNAPLVRQFIAAQRALLMEEAKPLGRRDPRPAIRLYAMAEVLATMLRAGGRTVDENDPGEVLDALRSFRVADTSQDGVHAAHCCARHGCKYGDHDCPVKAGRVQQEYPPCEFCDLDEEERREQAREERDQ